MKAIANDLIAEQALVDVLLADLTEKEWMLPLPGCAPWDIRDAVFHIAFFDYAANKLMRGEAEDLVTLADAEAGQDKDYRPTAFYHLSGREALQWWREERTRLAAAFFNMNPKDRIPWAPGMPMSARSLCSARLMELWAHSVDIYDALGKDVEVRDRIDSTLFLSWQARAFAYRINGFEMPDTPLYLELTLPSGKLWSRGEPDAANVIKGSAKDWALVSVRRRNWMDTGLTVIGDEARRYASIVQTYAGAADAAPAPSSLRGVPAIP